ncbi:MAG: NUDIX domain-containing protein [Acidobacteriota bacterium]|nr:NUDIX domain-containing protein [Acidobacteriota bacterium]
MTADPTDPFDVVRRLYRAINASDLDTIASLYADDAVAEQVFDGVFVIDGRQAILDAYRSEFGSTRGGLGGGERVRPRTIGGIQTGWGWVQADWIECIGGDGAHPSIQRAGHSHFLIEDARIRRHRRVITAEGEGVIDREPAPASSRKYPARPITGVGAVILMDAGVVLIKRRHEPLAGHWSLPGGTLDLGETLESAAAREALEETGLIVDVGPVVDVFDRILLDDSGKVRYHFVLVDYLCRPIGGELCAGSDAADAVIARPDDLARFRLAAKAADIIHKAFRMDGQW